MKYFLIAFSAFLAVSAQLSDEPEDPSTNLPDGQSPTDLPTPTEPDAPGETFATTSFTSFATSFATTESFTTTEVEDSPPDAGPTATPTDSIPDDGPTASATDAIPDDGPTASATDAIPDAGPTATESDSSPDATPTPTQSDSSPDDGGISTPSPPPAASYPNNPPSPDDEGTSTPPPPTAAPYPNNPPEGNAPSQQYEVSTITISTCIPTEITSVVTIYPSETSEFTTATYPPEPFNPTGVVPPSSNSTTAPSFDFTGAGSTTKAGGLLIVAGLFVALL